MIYTKHFKLKLFFNKKLGINKKLRGKSQVRKKLLINFKKQFQNSKNLLIVLKIFDGLVLFEIHGVENV